VRSNNIDIVHVAQFSIMAFWAPQKIPIPLPRARGKPSIAISFMPLDLRASASSMRYSAKKDFSQAVFGKQPSANSL
jgi:hypothetical protein